jgi:hypothetical protein
MILIGCEMSLYFKVCHNCCPSQDQTRAKLHRSFATTVSQLKMCDFSGETFKGFEVLFYEHNDDTTALQRRVFELRRDTIPVKSASPSVSFSTSNSKMSVYLISTPTDAHT